MRSQASSPARWNINASRWMLDSSSIITVIFVACTRRFEAFMSRFLHPTGNRLICGSVHVSRRFSPGRELLRTASVAACETARSHCCFVIKRDS